MSMFRKTKTPGYMLTKSNSYSLDCLSLKLNNLFFYSLAGTQMVLNLENAI